jgi:hypothetical protein
LEKSIVAESPPFASAQGSCSGPLRPLRATPGGSGPLRAISGHSGRLRATSGHSGRLRASTRAGSVSRSPPVLSTGPQCSAPARSAQHRPAVLSTDPGYGTPQARIRPHRQSPGSDSSDQVVIFGAWARLARSAPVCLYPLRFPSAPSGLFWGVAGPEVCRDRLQCSAPAPVTAHLRREFDPTGSAAPGASQSGKADKSRGRKKN